MAIAPNTTFVSGAVLTAAQQNAFGFSTVGMTTSTTLNQALVTTEVDITGMSVTFTAIASRNYKVSMFVYVVPTITNACANVKIKNGGTTLQTIITNAGVAASGATMTGFYVKNFTAGSITLKLTGSLQSGSTGTLTFFADGTLPAYILVEDVGPA